ncbi:MAG: protein kinase [Candidatus Aminicenantes bacterium]|jgi:serine/threonine protein kinase
MEDFPEISGYKIVSELGSGAVAVVYLGIQEKLERKVAIKVMEETILQKNKQIAKRFEREAKTAASLSHSNIIQIYDAGKEDRYYYIVMEYLEESLRDRQMRAPKYKIIPEAAVDIVADIMRALDYAHLKGIYHRDIKPDNIMFRQDGTPVLLDFGIARIFNPSEDLTKSKMSMGTTYYMSPEQCRAQKDLDGRSDVYSLGVVLYEMLTGEKPYKGDTPGFITSQHLDKPVPLLPEELSIFQALIDKMMAKNREKRISSRPELMQLIGEIPKSAMAYPSEALESPPLPETKPPSFQNIEFTTSTFHTTPKYSILKHSIKTIKSILHKSLDFIKGQLVLGILSLAVVFFLIYILFFHQGKGLKEKETPTLTGKEQISANEKYDRESIKQVNQHIVQAQEILKKLENTKDNPEVKELEKRINEYKDKKFNEFLTNAGIYFEHKDYLKAKKNVSLAKQIKETPELLALEKDIDHQLHEIEKNLKQIERDDQTYAMATSKNTVADYRRYLVEFPQGRHVKEITQKLKGLKESRQKQSKLKLRAEYKTLDKNSVESMIKQHDFFDNIMNEPGNFENNYERLWIGNSPVVIDYKTDLMWYDGESTEEMTFNTAEKWLKNLNKNDYAGYSDWRFPTLEEAASLLRGKENEKDLHIDPIFSGNSAIIWTGDRFRSNNVWIILFNAGIVEISHQDKQSQVRPVRSIE